MNNLNFRAWHKEGKKMYPVDGIMHYDQGTQIIVDGDIGFNLDEVILMQSTGLKDYKGVEIFEGDILRGTKSIHKEDLCQGLILTGHIGKEVKGFVKFSNTYAQYYFTTDEITYLDLVHGLNNFQVLGNIYEHLQILGEKS